MEKFHQCEQHCHVNQVSVMARMSLFFENNKSLSDAVLLRTGRTFVVTYKEEANIAKDNWVAGR